MKKYPEAKARDAATLQQQIMDPGIAKNDAEWWAMQEIERLRNAASLVVKAWENGAPLSNWPLAEQLNNLREVITHAHDN